MKRLRAIELFAFGLWGAMGCNALDTPMADDGDRVVPVDSRPVQQAITTPPSISGGTLAVSGDRVIVADSDRDVVSIVDVASGRVTGRIELEPGDEPGRVTVDARGMAHVALRRGGALLAIDPVTASITRRTQVCGAPRGVAYDASADRLHVACAGGELVALSAGNGVVAWRRLVDVDLRDVVVRGNDLVVSRFKTGEQIRVTKDGEVLSKVALSAVRQQGTPTEHNFDPSIAWRTVADSNGEIVSLHQRAQREEIVLDETPRQQSSGGSAYGGGSDFSFGPSCDGIVHSAVSVTDSYGQMRTSGPIPDVVLAVDAAVSSQWIALAVAGPADSDAPRPFVVRDSDDPEGSVHLSLPPDNSGVKTGVVLVNKSSLSVVSSGSSEASFFGCQDVMHVTREADDTLPDDPQVTSVAFMANGDLVYQTREPSALHVVEASNLGFGTFGSTSHVRRIELGGDSIADTGHDLFHRDSGGGIACASCHAEGGDDGHVWEFNTIGRRRTQQVNVGLEGTEPFHWDGDMSGLHQIMDTVFVTRMGGVRQSDDRLQAMSGWIFEQTPPASVREPSDPAAERGHALFMSPDVGCASCHSGTKLTNNRTVEVGTGEAGERFQVPSLVGIAYRAPFMHTGCAGTLRDRFTNTACSGGDQHGVTSQLSTEQIDDLVAYLETL